MNAQRLAVSAVLAACFLAWAGCSSDDVSISPAPVPGTDAAADATPDLEVEAEPPADAGAEAEVDAAVDPKLEAIGVSLEAERVALGAPGAAAAIIQGGVVTWSAGFGSKDPDAADPVHDTTLFRIGSITKMLTATGLLQLVEQGDVDLQAPITTYLPTLSFQLDASWAPSITIAHLLTHTSGIVDYIEVDSALRDDADLSGYLLGTFAQQQYLMAPAGRFYNYTNPGYMFAGLVTETVSGVPYRTNLDDRVLTPLGMDRTYFLPSEVLADGDYALGKTVDAETGAPMVAHPDTYDNAWARPAGYAWASVLDLAKFVTFLAKGDSSVLSDELRNEMKSPQVNTEEALDLQSYGYGLLVLKGVFLGSSYYDLTIQAHGGAIPGFAADMYYVPQCDLGFVTLASTDGAYFISTLVKAITTLCDLPAPSTPPDMSVNPASFDDYVGEYEDKYNAGPVTLTRVGDELHIAMPLLDQYNIPYEPLLVPTLPRNFIVTVQGAQLPLTVIVDGNGKGEYLRTRPFVAVRTPAPPPPPPALSPHGPDVVALLRAIRATQEDQGPRRLLRDSRSPTGLRSSTAPCPFLATIQPMGGADASTSR